MFRYEEMFPYNETMKISLLLIEEKSHQNAAIGDNKNLSG